MQSKFDLFDENKDGVLSRQELTNLLGSLGDEFTNELITQMFAQAESGNFYVDFDEFCEWVMPTEEDA